MWPRLALVIPALGVGLALAPAGCLVEVTRPATVERDGSASTDAAPPARAEAGSERGACLPGGRCAAGLICLSGLCVRLPASGVPDGRVARRDGRPVSPVPDGATDTRHPGGDVAIIRPDRGVPPRRDQVRTLAGAGGAAGFLDGPAARARFANPAAVAIGPAGELYVADGDNHRVRLVARGAVSTFAGSGARGYTDGPAAAARFNDPRGVAVDTGGRVYVSEWDGHRVRMIYRGQVSTVGGGGGYGFRDGPAASSRFASPAGLAVDGAGDVYVADTGNHRIRVISGGVASTLAGTGVAGYADGPATGARFDNPYGVAVDSSGRVYVAEQRGNRVRLISGGVVTTLAGSGTAGFRDGAGKAALLDAPAGLALGPGGELYVADRDNHRIRRIYKGVVTTVAGTGVAGFADGLAGAARFNAPLDVVVDRLGRLYVADSKNRRLRLVDR